MTPQFETIYVHTFQTADGHSPNLRERANMRKTCGPYKYRPTKPGEKRCFYSHSRNMLVIGDGSFSLRLELANDHLTGRLSHANGYYCDSDGDGDTLTPVIARLPHGRGFLAGWSMGAGMCGSIDPYVYADAPSAAMAAHSMAEYDAEENRNRQAEEDAAEAADAEEVEEVD